MQPPTPTPKVSINMGCADELSQGVIQNSAICFCQVALAVIKTASQKNKCGEKCLFVWDHVGHITTAEGLTFKNTISPVLRRSLHLFFAFI